MSRKAVASSVSFLLGIAFLLPLWTAAAYENDDVIFILFGFGVFFPVAVVVDLLALAWTIAVYSMRPSHRGSPWTAVAALGLGGVLAALVHTYLAGQARASGRASGQLDLYEDSYAGFWLAVATALVIGIVLAVAAPRRPRPTDRVTAPSLESRPPPPGP